MYPILQFDTVAGAAQLFTAVCAVVAVVVNYMFLARA